MRTGEAGKLVRSHSEEMAVSGFDSPSTGCRLLWPHPFFFPAFLLFLFCRDAGGTTTGSWDQKSLAGRGSLSVLSLGSPFSKGRRSLNSQQLTQPFSLHLRPGVPTPTCPQPTHPQDS